jgi:hypothetical protein
MEGDRSSGLPKAIALTCIINTHLDQPGSRRRASDMTTCEPEVLTRGMRRLTAMNEALKLTKRAQNTTMQTFPRLSGRRNSGID